MPGVFLEMSLHCDTIGIIRNGGIEMIRVGIAGIGFIAEEYIKLITTGRIQNAEIGRAHV